jgi:hypothetical protein
MLRTNPLKIEYIKTMKTAISTTFAVLILLVSCNQDNKPENVLDKNKMSTILLELHKAEAYINSNFQYNDTSKYIYKKLEDSILAANGTQLVAFDSSMAYYRRNIELLDEIYAEAIDSLSLEESLKK